MVAFPLVWLVSALTIIAAYVLAKNTRMPSSARLFLCAFLLSLATIGLLLGFRLTFGFEWAARIQPLVAVMVAPTAYLGFQALAQDRASSLRQTLLWNGVPIVLTQFAILTPLPVSPDVYVLAINSVYLFRLATLLGYGADDFPHVPSHSIRVLRLAIYATIVLLGMMVATDLLIVTVSVFAGEAFILRFLTGISGVFTAFIFVVTLIGAPLALHGPGNSAAKVGEASELDRALMVKLDALMTETLLYTDSNLTLARVARRLSVPVRDVSNATNKLTGENFSRYINGFRVRHAKHALRETELPIIEVMFESGFISKSSFNTELRRIVGQTPSQFRAKKSDA